MKYRLTVPVTAASGRRFYTVEADNEDHALVLWEAGEAVFEDEEVEVTGLGKPTVEEIE